jgi:hypothetical protein
MRMAQSVSSEAKSISAAAEEPETDEEGFHRFIDTMFSAEDRPRSEG